MGHITEGNLGKYLLPRLMPMQGDDLLEFSGFGDCLLAPIFSSMCGKFCLFRPCRIALMPHRDAQALQVDALQRMISFYRLKALAKIELTYCILASEAVATCSCCANICKMHCACSGAFSVFPPICWHLSFFPTKSIRESHQNITELKLQAWI